MITSKIKPKKPKPQGEYRNLEKLEKVWQFEVLTKATGWVTLTGLSSETSEVDAKIFAQATADSWRNK